MKKSFLSALMLILAIGVNAQNPAEWEKGQEVTENLLWTDYRRLTIIRMPNGQVKKVHLK